MPLEFVSRSRWTDFEEENPVKLNLPVYLVWYTVTHTHECADGEACKQRTRAIWREHTIDFKRKDIAYSFLIGGDGKVVEAKGWHEAPDLPVQFLSLRRSSIYIAFVGFYRYEDMPKELYAIADDLVKYGIKNNFITRKFILNDLLTPYSRKFRLENDYFMPGYIPDGVVFGS